MTTGTEALKLALRDYAVEGMPGLGANDPDKPEMREALDIIGEELAAAASGQNWKTAVRVASTANVAVASALINGAVMDGVTLATGDRVLLKNQTVPSENGPYTVAAAGAAARATDADTAAEITGALIFVKSGTANGNKQFALMTPAPITLGTTALTFDVVIDQGAVNASAVQPLVDEAEGYKIEADAAATAAIGAAGEVADSLPTVRAYPGKPSLSKGVSLEGYNSYGRRLWAVLDTGEARFPGSPTLDPTFAWSQLTPAGQTFYGIRHDGSYDFGNLNFRAVMSRAAFGLYAASGLPLIERDCFGADIEASDFDAWVNAGQVYVSARGVVQQMTAGTTYSYVKAEVRGGLLKLVRSDNVRILSPLAGASPALSGIHTIEYHDTFGQSNAAANASLTPVNATAFSDRAMMFGGGQRAYGNVLGHSQERTRPQRPVYDAIHDFVPGYEQYVDGAGETMNSGFAYGLLNGGGFNAAHAVVTTCSAVGSANLAMLYRAATANTDPKNIIGDPWANLEAKMWRAAMYWRMRGLRFIAGSLGWNQGEGDYAATKAAYLAGLQQIRSDWQGLAESLNAFRAAGDGGHLGKSPLITAQMCNGNHYGAVESQVPWAQLQINLDDPTTALCLGPTYDQLYAADDVHLLSLGQEMQGARRAMAYMVWLSGGTWKPLHIRKDAGHEPIRVGNVITCEVWNPFNTPLSFDTTTITGLGADQGIQFTDDSGSATNTLTEIVDNTHIRLTLTGTPTATNKRIQVAMNGASGGAPGPATGNRSTLRDSGSGLLTRGGRAVRNFICIDSIPVA